MIPDPWLYDAVDRLPGGPLVCCVLGPVDIFSLRRPAVRLLSPRCVDAWEYEGAGVFVRVHVWGASTPGLYQVRRRIAEPVIGRAVSMEELKLEELRAVRRFRKAMDDASTALTHSEHVPGAMDEHYLPDRIFFDDEEPRYPAPDLPPPMWPSTGVGELESIRAIYRLHGRRRTSDQEFASRARGQGLTERANDASAVRVLAAKAAQGRVVNNRARRT